MLERSADRLREAQDTGARARLREDEELDPDPSR